MKNDYLSKHHYQNTSRTNDIVKTIKKTANKSNNESILYYKKHHNHIPSWVLVNSLPFRMVIQWFTILDIESKTIDY